MRRSARLIGWSLLASGIVLGVIIWRVHDSPRTIHDYAAGAEGIVMDPQGRPISEAAIHVEFRRRVFDAVTPLRRATTLTDKRGVFDATFISCGRRGGPYLLTVRKAGYKSAMLSEDGFHRHRIVLFPE